MDASLIKRLRELEQENLRLKKSTLMKSSKRNSAKKSLRESGKAIYQKSNCSEDGKRKTTWNSFSVRDHVNQRNLLPLSSKTGLRK